MTQGSGGMVGKCLGSLQGWSVAQMRALGERPESRVEGSAGARRGLGGLVQGA